jgi:uncharacterized membrane protein YeaQ/YmgE (transglycosylase-associated protein family)
MSIARLLMPGRDPIGIIGTLVLGVVGSLLGGFLGYVTFGKDIADGARQGSGLVGAVIGAWGRLTEPPVVLFPHRAG